MNLIVPIAGRSSRFPDLKPKWMLTHPRGNMMVVEALKGLDLTGIDRIYVVGLQEYQDRHGFVRSLEMQFEEQGIADRVQFVLLADVTRNRAVDIEPSTTDRQDSIQGHRAIDRRDAYRHFDVPGSPSIRKWDTTPHPWASQL